LQQRRSRFLQTAAHQLKSPLAVIQTFAGLIRDEVVTGTAVRDTCKKIIFRCQDGIAQVTELLTLARLHEADTQRRTDAVADIREVLKELCANHAPLAESKKVRLTCVIPDDLDLTARLSTFDLTACIGNLIDNAIKFTPGPGTVTVTAGRCGAAGPSADTHGTPPASGAAAPPGDHVFVTVSDTGMGIDAAILKTDDPKSGEGTIFDAFRRGNSALAAGIPGTGLGLSIVREVVEQAGGRIHLHSVEGRGSTFTVVFPSREVAQSDLAVRNTRASTIVVETAPPDGSA
jgi:signal transduction histidine kinase